jgi:hypothetical protein
MLGANGPRNYLLVFENDAEARGLGGLPGAFAILHADAGMLRFTRFGNDTALAGAYKPPAFDEQFEHRYSTYGVGVDFRNSDMSPHFPYAAQIWLSMWQQQTGQRLDGALATDPQALAYLLGVVGPSRLPDGTEVSANNVVQLTESTVYARFANSNVRKAFFVQVARAVVNTLLQHSGGRARELAQAFGTAVGQRRLLVWSSHPAEEALLSRLPVGGVLPETRAPFVALVVNNAAGSKLDYYLDRSLTYTAGGCNNGRRRSTVRVRLHNAAPASGLPTYVTFRADNPTPPVATGTERLLVSIYATQGAQLLRASVNGTPVLVVPELERDHLILTVDVELPPGASDDIVFRLDEPARTGRLITVVQPLVRPMKQRLATDGC